MKDNEITGAVVDVCYHMHRELGPGLLESVYEIVLAHELKAAGMRVERQVSIPIMWRGISFEEGFRADMVVEDRVIVEVKSVEKMAPAHSKQLLTYLRLTDRRVGLLINFGEALIKNGIHRVVNRIEEDDPRKQPSKNI